MAEKEKPLPHSIEAEQQLLGAILVDNQVFARVSHFLRAEDFYEAVHSEIYAAIETLIGQNKVATPVTMKPIMMEIQAGDMTGPQYIALLTAEATTLANAVDYARLIKDESVKRQAFIFTDELRKNIMTPGFEASKLLDSAEIFFADVRPKSDRAEQFVPFSRAVEEAVDIANMAYGRQGVLSGLSTGIDKLDDILGGLNKSDLIIVAGRPGMGKTALAINITFTVAKDLRERRIDGQKTGVVAFFSLEMPRNQIANRILAEHSKISSWRVRKGTVSETAMGEFIDAGRVLANLPIYIDHTGALPIHQLMTRIRALKKRVGVEAVIVDYLQLLKGSGGGRNKEQNRVSELTEITGMLKAIAKELDVPVIALSQLSRKVEERDDKRPKLADLRESGSIEQDADTVLMVYREEYYLVTDRPREGSDRFTDWQAKLERARGRAELIVEKNRHGPPGAIEVGYNATLTQFNNDVPESVADGVTPKEKRERKKQISLPGEASIAWKRLQTLQVIAGIENDSIVDKAPKGVKLVKYADWKKRVCEEIEPEGTEAKHIALMKRVTVPLLDADLIGHGGSKAEHFVWLIPEKK